MSNEDMDITQMVNPAMRLMEELTKDIKSENKVAQFIENNLSGLFAGEVDMATRFLIKMSMGEANKNPEAVLKKLLVFYSEFKVFYADINQK